MTSRPDARAALQAAVVDDPGAVLLALDFDGTLAPIVDDPANAHVHPDSLTALERLGDRLGGVAIVTGRPVEKVLELGSFRGRHGLARLAVRGQYGAERWSAVDDVVTTPDAPEVIAQLVADLPAWLAERGLDGARLEDKTLAVGVHTRGGAPDLFERVRGPLTELAHGLGLTVEPGRQVIELRAVATDKGVALRDLVDRLGSEVVVYAGDDLGDVPAYDAVDALEAEGITGFRVCSSSPEQDALLARADVVLDGPDGVAAWLTELADAL